MLCKYNVVTTDIKDENKTQFVTNMSNPLTSEIGDVL